MTVKTQFPYDKEYVTTFSEKNNEPSWMKSLRLRAFDLAHDLNMPEPDKTNIRRWNFTNFELGAEGSTISSLQELPEQLTDFVDQENVPANIQIQQNGTISFSALSEDLKEKGVIFTDIFTAMQEHSDIVEKYFMTDGVSIDEHRLTALHAAYLNGGVFVYVPKGVKVEEPIQAIFWQEDNTSALFNHVLIVAEKDSELTFVENYVSHNTEEETVSNVVAEVFAHDDAKVSYGSVDNFAAGTTSYINRRGVADERATIDWALGQMNDGNTVSENVTHLVGQFSVTNARSVTAGRGKQSQNFTSVTHHHGKDSDGQILQRGVLRDKTTSIFNAIGKIEHGATRANAEQESRVLMLSGDARGDANPILLIDEDDVTAGHAASVGRVDEFQMYYLQSRGITKDEAERLIILGFLEPVVNELPIASIQKQLRTLIERKIY